MYAHLCIYAYIGEGCYTISKCALENANLLKKQLGGSSCELPPRKALLRGALNPPDY